MSAADVQNNLALAEKTGATSRKNKKQQRVNSVCLHLPATGVWEVRKPYPETGLLL
ncbi:MAG TPA: hypothetical protein V6D28_07390 [Leptolyngbyaceae cyanobacterium]